MFPHFVACSIIRYIYSLQFICSICSFTLHYNYMIIKKILSTCRVKSSFFSVLILHYSRNSDILELFITNKSSRMSPWGCQVFIYSYLASLKQDQVYPSLTGNTWEYQELRLLSRLPLQYHYLPINVLIIGSFEQHNTRSS